MNVGLTIITAVIIGGVAGGLLGRLGSCQSGSCPFLAKPWRGALLGGLVAGLIAASLTLQGNAEPEAEPENEEQKMAAADSDPADADEDQSSETEPDEETKPADENGKVKKLPKADDFQAMALESEKPVLVDFYADWCPPCQQMEPVLKEIAAQKHELITILKVDVDQFQGLAREYGVQGIPHLIIFKDGEILDQTTGGMPQETLEGWIDETLAR